MATCNIKSDSKPIAQLPTAQDCNIILLCSLHCKWHVCAEHVDVWYVIMGHPSRPCLAAWCDVLVPVCWLQIYGIESAGKTTLALHAIAEVQKSGGIAAFIDAEHALSLDHAQVRTRGGGGARACV